MVLFYKTEIKVIIPVSLNNGVHVLLRRYFELNSCSFLSSFYQFRKMVFRKFPVLLFAYGFTLITCSAQGTWVQKASMPTPGRITAVAFTIGAKGYLGTGYLNNTDYNDLWEYDPLTDLWTQKADFPSGQRYYAAGFSIGSKGYIGTGINVNGGTGSITNDLWEYNPITNSWLKCANMPASPRTNAVAFSIGMKGYIGAGGAGNVRLQDFWEYDPMVNSWTQLADFTGTARQNIGRAVFVIGNKAYLGTGSSNGIYYNDFWEYDPATNLWTRKADFPGSPRSGATGFSVCGSGYLGLGGVANAYQADFWKYTPATNSWIAVNLFAGGARTGQPSFVLNEKAYVGTGYGIIGHNDLWEFNPAIATINSSSTSICNGQTVTLTATGGSTYIWNTGETTNPIFVSPSSTTTYSITASDVCVRDTIAVTITVLPPVTIVITASANTICAGQTATLSASDGGNYVWNTGATTSTILVSPSVTTTYSLTVSNACGSDSAFLQVSVFPYIISQFSFTIFDDTCGFPIIEFTNNSINSNSWIWNFGDGNSSTLQHPIHSYSSPGTYDVLLIANNSDGCSDSSQLTVTIEAVPTPLFIPNAFSPNGDNENDFFILQRTECLKKVSLIVYNRWGEKIFKTTHQNEGWDGTQNGKKENSGVYTYYLEATLISGEVMRRKGNVTLLR